MGSDGISQTFIQDEFTKLELMYTQEVMHFESALLTKLGEAHAEQRYAPELPNVVV